MNRYRYYKDKTNAVLISVNGAVTVQVGDMMFLDSEDNLRNDGSSTADNTAYPFEYFRISGASLELNRIAVKNYFLGIAMEDKDGEENGPSINIPIYTSGQYDLDLKPGRSVDVGDMFCASGTTSASNLFNQKVMITSEVSKALGYFTEKKINANNAYGFIRTSIGNKIN